MRLLLKSSASWLVILVTSVSLQRVNISRVHTDPFMSKSSYALLCFTNSLPRFYNRLMEQYSIENYVRFTEDATEPTKVG